MKYSYIVEATRKTEVMPGEKAQLDSIYLKGYRVGNRFHESTGTG
jgi:hypothetical protein